MYGTTGDDRIRGGPGGDYLRIQPVTPTGKDHFLGGTGKDSVYGEDGHGGDVVNGGSSSSDSCSSDPRDRLRACEKRLK